MSKKTAGMIVVLTLTALALAGWWWYEDGRQSQWDVLDFKPNQGETSVKKYNRLGETKSPYLLQHKDNPVHWFPWGEEAFRAAREENKIIFLSIGYSTCYWCHMMEKDSFEKQEVADYLNKYYISIKVDREEHPDIDQIYMDAVVGMTGQGGWPMSVFLTPDLKPFFGGSFFWQAQFMQILDNIQQTWQKEPQKILASGAKTTDFLREKTGGAAAEEISTGLLKKAFVQFQQSFDKAYGGFGQAPKFPHSMNLSLLLRIHHRTGSKEALAMVTKSLDAMAAGEIYDKIGGGFHRYATHDDWNEPHYEKMLYDNALLAFTYLEGYQVTKNKNYAEVVKGIFRYFLGEMTDPQGGFYSAQDAGEVGKEGEYYHLSKENRAQSEPPAKDDKILTSWNGLMIGALAKGYQVLGDEKYLKAAQNSAQFIRKNLYRDEKLLRRFREGEAKFDGTLEDYAFLIHGLLSLYEADGNADWVHWALKLQTKQDEIFWDEENGGYFMGDPNDPALLVKKKELHDGATPSGNAVAALNLVRLHALTFEQDILRRAERLLKIIAGGGESYPAGFAQGLIAIDFYSDRSKEIAVVGRPTDPDYQAMQKYLFEEFIPNKMIAFGPPSEFGDEKILPVLRGKQLLNEKTTIYVCENNVCKLPTSDLPKARELIKDHLPYEL